MKAVGVFAVKGGVGKTLVSINLALRLAKRWRVGLLDADWDNSNFAQFTQLDARIDVTKDNKFVLPEWNGIKIFSPSLLLGRDVGVSMTGDRYVQMLSDAVEFGDWGDLDYMVIDLPGGSSDVWKGVLTIFGRVLLGDVVVTQPLTIDSLVKGLKLHKYFDVPVIGVISNMSYLVCPHGERVNLFGDDSEVEAISKELGYEYLGEVPFVANIRELIKSGNPMIESETLDKLAARVESMELPKTSFLERFKEEALGALRTEVEKVLATLIVRVQKEIRAADLAARAGFTEQRPFMLTITNDDGTVVLTRVPLRVKDGRLIVISNPSRVDFEISMSLRTLARVLLRRARVGDRVVEFDPVTAWTAGDIKVYGTGFTPRAIKVIRDVLTDERLLSDIASKYGKVLERWI